MTEQNNVLKDMDDDELAEFLSDLTEIQYQRNRKQFAKDTGLGVRALDAYRKESTGGSEEQGAQADELVSMIQETATLFHDPNNVTYVQIEENGHKENWPLQSEHFRDLAGGMYLKEFEKVVNDSAIKSAMSTLNGLAKFEGDTHEVAVRTAVIKNTYYVDLANSDWEVVEIKAGKWKVLKESPVRFIRDDHMLSLPTPAGKGDLNKLWRFVHVHKNDRSLLLAAMIETCRPDTPYPIAEFTGFAGSGKSTLQEYIRMSIDPNTQPLRSAPGSVQDIFIGANSCLITSLNNISHLSPQQQDALCILSTGGSYSTRKLYTNLGEISVDVKRPVLLNGIHPSVTATDLVDRLVHFKIPQLEKYTSEKVLAAEFTKQHRAIFTGLLDLFAETLRILPSVKADDSIRMVDFAILGEAVFEAIGEDRTFAEVFGAKRVEAQRASMETSPCMMALQPFLATQPDQAYSGAYGKLLDKMKAYRTGGGDAWPTSGRGISALLTRFADGLIHFGVIVRFDSNHYNDGSHVHIKLVNVNNDPSEHPSDNTIPSLADEFEDLTGMALVDDDDAFLNAPVN